MIRTYYSLSGQSIYDVCLTTYGGLTYLFKLMADNNFPGVNAYPTPGYTFQWDDTLIVDDRVSISNQAAGTNYATMANTTGAVYYSIKEDGTPSGLPPAVSVGGSSGYVPGDPFQEILDTNEDGDDGDVFYDED